MICYIIESKIKTNIASIVMIRYIVRSKIKTNIASTSSIASIAIIS